jgi:hypothetical protein
MNTLLLAGTIVVSCFATGFLLIWFYQECGPLPMLRENPKLIPHSLLEAAHTPKEAGNRGEQAAACPIADSELWVEAQATSHPKPIHASL